MRRLLPTRWPEPIVMLVILLVGSWTVSLAISLLFGLLEYASLAEGTGSLFAFASSMVYFNFYNYRRDRDGHRNAYQAQAGRTSRSNAGIPAGNSTGAGTGQTANIGARLVVERRLPQLSTTNWQMAWKTANLLMSLDGRRIEFLQVYAYGITRPYGVDSEASCNIWPYHKVPHDEANNPCKCGFNAFDDEADARVYHAQPWRGTVEISSLVLMRVGLYGDLIEGTFTNGGWGYRSSKQRVADVFIANACSVCERHLEPGEQPWLQPTLYDDRSYEGMSYLLPVCDMHKDEDAISFEQAERILGGPHLHTDSTLPGCWEIVTQASESDDSNQQFFLPTETIEQLEALCARDQLDVGSGLVQAISLYKFLNDHVSNGSQVYVVDHPWWKLWNKHLRKVPFP